MSLRPYDFSTSKLTGFSGGASPTDFTTLWGLKFFPQGTVPSSTTAAATWTTGSRIGRLQHEVSLTFTGAEVTEKDLQEFMYRALCHLFIDALPVDALEEIAECIVDNYKRHVVRP